MAEGPPTVTSLASDAKLDAVQAACRRFVILLVGLALTVAVATIAIWPWPYVAAVERFMLPQYENPWGFRGGRVVPDPADSRHTIYALVDVVPDGPMARAGARSGDIPVAHHGGLDDFYVALQEASSGGEGHFDVLALSDWPDWSKRRRITLSLLPTK